MEKIHVLVLILSMIFYIRMYRKSLILACTAELWRNISWAPSEILTNGKKRWTRMEKDFHLSPTCIFDLRPPYPLNSKSYLNWLINFSSFSTQIPFVKIFFKDTLFFLWEHFKIGGASMFLTSTFFSDLSFKMFLACS